MEQKKYTDISIVTALKNDGGQYAHITMPKVLVTADKIDLRHTSSNKTVASFRTPINNRGKLIAGACGTAPQENGEGTCFATISFWDNTATSLMKMCERHSKFVVSLDGSVRVTTRKGNDNKEYINVEITAFQWWFQRDVKAADGSAPQNSAPNAAPANAGYVPPAGFYDIPDDDDDEVLPF